MIFNFVLFFLLIFGVKNPFQSEIQKGRNKKMFHAFLSVVNENNAQKSHVCTVNHGVSGNEEGWLLWLSLCSKTHLHSQSEDAIGKIVRSSPERYTELITSQWGPIVSVGHLTSLCFRLLICKIVINDHFYFRFSVTIKEYVLNYISSSLLHFHQRSCVENPNHLEDGNQADRTSYHH